MKNEIVTIGAFAALTFVDPMAAAGALAGVCFFIAMPYNAEWWRMILLAITSGFMGYGAGVSSWGSNSPLLWSSIVAALSVAALTSARGVIKDRFMDLINIAISIVRK